MSLRRREFFQAAGAAAFAPRLRAQQAGKRPNIILLLTDDQTRDSLGCMGNPIVRTPHIDTVAEQGVTFTNAFVTTSICMTSRASIFTGLYAHSHQINSFATPFTESQYARIYPELLRRAGYHVGLIGKYGVGQEMPEDRFDYWRGFPGQGSYFPGGEGKPHLTEIMGDQSLEFLRTAPRAKPFCLSVSFKAPHVQDNDPRQFLHSPETADLYRDARIPEPETADRHYISMLPIEVQRSEGRRRWAVRFSTPTLYQESVKSYYRLITEVDTVVGRIRKALRESGADRNTIILFTSDNGFYLGEHGLAGKWLMHEESIRVPMIVYDPRLPNSKRGLRRDEMALNLDVAPTILHAAGIEPHPSVQGRNLYRLFEDGPAGWRKDWFYEHEFTASGWIPHTEGVRGERWKYTRYLDTEPVFEELFDLESDPREKNNLAKDVRYRQQLHDLRNRYEAWRDRLKKWSPDSDWSDPT